MNLKSTAVPQQRRIVSDFVCKQKRVYMQIVDTTYWNFAVQNLHTLASLRTFRSLAQSSLWTDRCAFVRYRTRPRNWSKIGIFDFSYPKKSTCTSDRSKTHKTRSKNRQKISEKVKDCSLRSLPNISRCCF